MYDIEHSFNVFYYWIKLIFVRRPLRIDLITIDCILRHNFNLRKL